MFVGLGFQVAEGPEVETDWYNFEALNMDEDAPGAERLRHAVRRPRPEPGRVLLRTHTSPVQIRAMVAQAAADLRDRCRGGCSAATRPTPPTCRCSTRSRAWSSTADISMADLAGTIEAFTKAFFGSDFTSRLRPAVLPVHRAVGEFDIRTPSGAWLELGGCGMVHPNVLRHGGIDPEEWSGFAFGFGIDRMAKERHAISDLREMFTGDIRFAEQF